ncbi:MAG: MFS transporter [Bdellovibrionales bacterium]
MNRKRSMLIIFITVFVDLVGFGVVIPLHAYLARNFQADELQVGLLMAVYSLMQFIFAPMWGSLSDKYGRRPIILMSLLGASLSHVGFAFASTYWGLFAARIFAGIFGANISAAMAYVADISPPEKRSQSMGLVGAAIGLGFVFGPFIGGFFGDLGMSMGDAPPFGQSFGAVVAGAICFLNFIFAVFALKESRDLSKDEDQFRMSALQKLFLIKEYLFVRAMKTPMWIYLLCMIAMGHMEVSMFLFVKDKFDWGLASASYGFAYMGVIMVFTQGFLVRKFLPLWGERKLLVYSLSLYGASLLGVAMSPSIPVLGIFVTLLGVAIGLSNPSMTGSISVLSDKEEQGSVLGVTQSLAAMGRILGPSLGSLYYRDISMSAPFIAGAGLVFISLILVAKNYHSLPEPSLVRNNGEN